MAENKSMNIGANSKLKWLKRSITALVIVTALIFVAYKGLWYYFYSKMVDASYFEDEIAAFEMRDRTNPPEKGRVLFIGSSSIRLWDTLERDMAPLKVINRGFGGSMVHHSTYFADRIVTPYKPSAIVYYGGSNDIGNMASPRSPEQLAQDFDSFVSKVHEDVGAIPIIYISIKPTELRASQWPEMKKANELIAANADTNASLHYIDIATDMLDEKGNPRGEYFVWDGLHMNTKAYALWTSIIRPKVQEIVTNSSEN